MNGRKRLHLRMRKIYVSFLAVLSVCALTLHFVYLVQSFYSMQEQTRQERQHVLDQKVYHTERYLKEIEDCANMLSVSPRLQQILIQRQRPDYLAYADCRDLLAEYVMAPYDIYRLDLYVSSSQSLITSSEGVFYQLDAGERAIYESLQNSSREAGGSLWTCGYQTMEPSLVSRIRNARYITLAKEIVSMYTGDTRGVLLLSIAYDHFAPIIAATESDEYGSLFFEGVQLCGEIARERGYETLTTYSDEIGFAFTYSYRFRFSALLTGRFATVLAIIMVLFLLGFVQIVLIAEQRVGKPVEKLLDGFERMEEGAFSTRMNNDADEIFGDLNRSFDHMAGHLQATVSELVDEKTRGRELKQRLLMTQLKPHFLYNIFNNMIWLVEQKKYENLEQLVTATAGFFKLTLNEGSRDMMLFENQRQLEYYVSIQKFRFGDRFDLEMTIADGAENLMIPNLLLQPLVENAINHGFSGLTRRGRIQIAAELCGEKLVITVRDNGRGMRPELLAEVREAMANEDGRAHKFFALVNVANWLRNRYGKASFMTIDSEADCGVTIRIGIPVAEQMAGG